VVVVSRPPTSQRVRGALSPARPPAFTDEQVRQIREERAAGTSAVALAATYGVAAKTIRDLVAGRTYGWVR
jgi:hypothetical protein